MWTSSSLRVIRVLEDPLKAAKKEELKTESRYISVTNHASNIHKQNSASPEQTIILQMVQLERILSCFPSFFSPSPGPMESCTFHRKIKPQSHESGSVAMLQKDAQTTVVPVTRLGPRAPARGWALSLGPFHELSLQILGVVSKLLVHSSQANVLPPKPIARC